VLIDPAHHVQIAAVALLDRADALAGRSLLRGGLQVAVADQRRAQLIDRALAAGPMAVIEDRRRHTPILSDPGRIRPPTA
jgi:hypothetical protein